jgi:hypothetical protein
MKYSASRSQTAATVRPPDGNCATTSETERGNFATSEYIITQTRHCQIQKEKDKEATATFIRELQGDPENKKLRISNPCEGMCDVGKPLWQPHRSIPMRKETSEEKAKREKREGIVREQKRRANRKRRV